MAGMGIGEYPHPVYSKSEVSRFRYSAGGGNLGLRIGTYGMFERRVESWLVLW